MNKKQGLFFFSIFELLFLIGILILYHEFGRIVQETNNQVDMIRFGNRISFLIVGMVIPIVHLLGIVEYFWPGYIKKNKHLLNLSLIAIGIALLVAGFAGSAWIKSKVENAEYFYCRNASGVSALARTLVYTKNMETCEELVASKQKR
jgi:hypothetical protein